MSWRKLSLALGIALIAAGVYLLWPRSQSVDWLIGMHRGEELLECYEVRLDAPARVAVQDQFVVTGTVSGVGWGLKRRPNISLKLSAAGMKIDPSDTIPATPEPPSTSGTIRWSVKSESAGRYNLVVNPASNTHPLKFINTNGVIPVDVYAPWTSIISPHTGVLLTFLGSFATLPGLLEIFRKPRKKEDSRA